MRILVVFFNKFSRERICIFFAYGTDKYLAHENPVC